MLTVNLAPELDELEAHGFLELVESELNAHALIDVEGYRTSGSQVLNMLLESGSVHIVLKSLLNL